MSYSQLLLTIRSQRHEARIRHDGVRRLVDERRSQSGRRETPV